MATEKMTRHEKRKLKRQQLKQLLVENIDGGDGQPSLSEIIGEIERSLAVRMDDYPVLIGKGKLNSLTAIHRTNCFRKASLLLSVVLVTMELCREEDQGSGLERDHRAAVTEANGGAQ